MTRAAAAMFLLTAALWGQPKVEFEHYQLPNGMQVIPNVERKTRLVHSNLRFRVGERPITAEELADAKQNIIRGHSSQFEFASSTADSISQNWAAGLPLSELETWPRRIAAATLEQVNAAARKYARPDEAVFLLVGDREKMGALEGVVVIP